jgi:hypothetical protein
MGKSMGNKTEEKLFPVDERGILFYNCIKNSDRRVNSHPYFLGHLTENRDDREHQYELHWIPNVSWDDTMRVIRTHEQKTILQSQTTGIYYVIFPADLCVVIQQKTIDHGIIQGTWRYIQHGNYGIALVIP